MNVIDNEYLNIFYGYNRIQIYNVHLIIIHLYHLTKIQISFGIYKIWTWNLKFLIQWKPTLPLELTVNLSLFIGNIGRKKMAQKMGMLGFMWWVLSSFFLGVLGVGLLETYQLRVKFESFYSMFRVLIM